MPDKTDKPLPPALAELMNALVDGLKSGLSFTLDRFAERDVPEKALAKLKIAALLNTTAAIVGGSPPELRGELIEFLIRSCERCSDDLDAAYFEMFGYYTPEWPPLPTEPRQ